MKTIPSVSPFYYEFAAQVNSWPARVQLLRAAGDSFVAFEKHDSWIEAKWAGHIVADDVVTAAKLLLQLLQKVPCYGLLNDKSEVTGDWQEANDWLEFEWLPQVLQAGLRCIAHVYSENMFSRLSARDLQQRLMPSLQMQNFSDHAHAMSWLQNCLSCRLQDKEPGPAGNF
ncbi:hypothetical protein [Pontibacter chitinilyticus]|uniref:hypothetical protein n=1 Tax=Pontibacter chitinilyticus TaxID=2674989 RepID=UPI00321BCBC8